jgi:hypothetical protein
MSLASGGAPTDRWDSGPPTMYVTMACYLLALDWHIPQPLAVGV